MEYSISPKIKSKKRKILSARSDLMEDSKKFFFSRRQRKIEKDLHFGIQDADPLLHDESSVKAQNSATIELGIKE